MGQILFSRSHTEIHFPVSVPQGLVLGPLFFSTDNLPIADIIKSHDIEYHLYADDTQLCLSFDLINTSASSDRKQNIERSLEKFRHR